jgi:hypothetical protein
MKKIKMQENRYINKLLTFEQFLNKLLTFSVFLNNRRGYI